MSEEDPFERLVGTLQVIEHYDRALCLIAIYLGQRADQNTIKGITEIYTALLGRPQGITTARVRGYITSMVNVDILEREREQIISSTKVSFHTISPLGELALLYILVTFVTPDPLQIEWDLERFKEKLSMPDNITNEESVIRFLVDTMISNEKILDKVLSDLLTGKDPEKIRTKQLIFETPKTFSGKSLAFKIFEDLIWDYLSLGTGFSKKALAARFKGTSVGGSLNKLSPYIIEETYGKLRYYRISLLGIYILPILAFIIRRLSIERSVLPSILSSRIDIEKNPWLSLVEQAKKFFKTLYTLP
ncbi:MAG: hypothetical protein ACFFE8_13700 [Candidatus Heimdallarchaeota archaeon]